MLDDTSNYAYEWKKARQSKFTSSNIWKICQPKGLGDEGMKYVRTRAFEYISGISTEKDFLTQSTAEGIINEIPGLRKFGLKMGLQSLVTQTLVFGKDNRFASTPDALIVRKETTDSTCYDVSTVEIKCFGPERHMEIIECNTYDELLQVDRKTVMQALDQMSVIDCLQGYIVYYHPDLPEDRGGLKIFELNKMAKINNTYSVLKDIQFIETRKREAIKEFEKRIAA